MKIIYPVMLAVAICALSSGCKEAVNTEDFSQMRMVYEENPAFFFKDMKLVCGNKEYYESNVPKPKRGEKIGYATDEYNGWEIYRLKGYSSDYLMAVEKNNEDCWRVMSIYPPQKPWRIYILENATDKQKFERLLSIRLYENGTAQLTTPPISSYLMIGAYYYAFEDGELLIFQVRDNPIAIFAVQDDSTIAFKSATVPLFADAGALYTCK